MNHILKFPSEHIMTFEYSDLRISILGGIDINHFDRLRVTMKLEILQRKFPDHLEQPEIANLALRQNLDLYNDIQVEKFIRKASERMEMGTTALIQAIAELTEQLEAYRYEQWKAQQHAPKELPVITESQRQAALYFLEQPGLMDRTSKAIEESGVVGEQLNRLLMYIIFTSRKRQHPLHVISLASSGAGKTHLQETVAQLIPDEDKIEITSLSENALYYFDKQALSHKLLLIEDLDGAATALFPIRELQSKRKITKTISYKDSKGNTRTQQLQVEGPVSVAGCTTKESIYEDNANRSFLVYLDESKEQDQAIMDYQRKRSAGKADIQKEQDTRQLLQNCQRILQPVTVINPYAELLHLPQEILKPRRTNKHYLDFIEAVTFYHQCQRTQQVNEQTGEIFIQTTPEDIAEANRLMKEVLLRKSDVLPGAVRNYLERLRKYLEEQKLINFTSREMQLQFRLSHSTVKRYHKELQEAGMIQLKEVKNRSYEYQLSTGLDYTRLKSQVDHILDYMLESIQSGSKKQPKSPQRLKA